MSTNGKITAPFHALKNLLIDRFIFMKKYLSYLQEKRSQSYENTYGERYDLEYFNVCF